MDLKIKIIFGVIAIIVVGIGVFAWLSEAFNNWIWGALF